jgi:hypothetical protein
MSNDNHRDRGAARHVRQIARRVASVVAECNYAQRRLTELRLSPHRYVYDNLQTPGGYSEFLIHTSGSLRHEPSARDRAAGRPCCR